MNALCLTLNPHQAIAETASPALPLKARCQVARVPVSEAQSPVTAMMLSPALADPEINPPAPKSARAAPYRIRTAPQLAANLRSRITAIPHLY
ncbi:MAG: hypothetical protein NVS3B1_12770 [Marmoricola sp.]